MKKNTLLHHRRMLLLLLILMTASTVTLAEIVQRTLVSQNYEQAQAADWIGDEGASITLATGDAVNGTCVQIEATEGNVGVYLPITLPDEVYYNSDQMETRGWVAEFDFMIRSGNVEKVSQSQLFVLTQGYYPYYNPSYIPSLEACNLNAGGQPYSSWDDNWGWCLSQPVRDASTYSQVWYSDNESTKYPAVLEDNKWYHVKVYPTYTETGQYPGFWFESSVWDKETGEYIYDLGGGKRSDALSRLTGFCALVGQGGMLKFDNLVVYDYTQDGSGVKQTLMAPYHYSQGYDSEMNTCGVWIESDQSWLDYVGDDMPRPTIMYAIDNGEYQAFSAGGKEWEPVMVPIGSQLHYYATLEGYNDSPVVTVTATIPMWNMGVENQWWEGVSWDFADRTPITLGEETETGLFQMKAAGDVVLYNLLTPNANINDNFMIRNYSAMGGKEVIKSRKEAPRFERRQPNREAKVMKKSRNLEEIDIHGIYSGDDRVYAMPNVVEGSYIVLDIQSVENRAVVTTIEGCEVDEWDSELVPDRAWYVLKVTDTGTAKFSVNSGTAITEVGYYAPVPPQAPVFSLLSLNGANRTYQIYGEGATKIHYTTVPATEQPALDSNAWSVAGNSLVSVTTTGTGYLYAYSENSMGTSGVTSQYVNGVVLTLATPFIYSKSFDDDTQQWTVTLYNGQNYIDGIPTNAKVYYSIDGGQETEYTEAFTIANGSQLSYYAKATGFNDSPTATCTAGAPTINELNFEQKWSEYYYYSSYYNYRTMTLGDESEAAPGWYKLLADGNQLVNGNLLTENVNIDDQFRLRYYGLYSPVSRTYALTGLNTEQYVYIITNDEGYTTTVTPIEGLEYDAWNSTTGMHYFKVTANGTVKFTVSGKGYLRQVVLYQEPQYGYVDVADANGNTLKYYYDSAESDAQFYGVTSYADDETKTGHIIIADKVTDKKGHEHKVTTVNGGVNNRTYLKSVVFGQNITTVGSDAFSSCSLLESVTLNSNLETLGSYAFQNCYKLASANLQDTKVTSIPYYCFYRAGLTEINIPATITEMGSSAFYGCDSMVTVTVDCATIPQSCFQAYDSDKSKLTTINIGKNVKSIGNYAFRYQDKLTAVNIDPEVSGLTIGSSVFNDCDALETITLPAGVTSLGSSVFSDCDNLKTVIFDENSTIEAIPNSCFSYCESLETLTLPNSVKTIGSNAFYYCTNLRELTFGTGLEENGFPNDYNLFYNCTNMEKMTLPGNNFPFPRQYSYLPNTMTLFVNADMLDTYKESDYTKMYHIVAIGVTTDFVIENEAGGLAAKLPSGKAPNAISLTISGQINGTDVNYIHQSMPYLQELILTNAQIVTGGEDVKRFSVNNGVVSQSGSKTYAVKNDSVCDYMFNNMPTLKHIALPAGAKFIGKYALSSNAKLEQVDMGSALTAIDEYAFYNDSKLKKADLPAGLKTIGQQAFYYTAITSLTIPDVVKRIEYYTFYNCDNLKSVTLPDGLEYIGQNAFYYCDNLESVNIPTQVVTIDQYAFSNCPKLASPIVIPAGCVTIGSSAFSSDNLIPSVTFSEGSALTTIGNNAFSNCYKIEEVALPESLTSLGSSAFSNCSSLTSFTFPANIKEVPSSVLYNCKNLESVTLAEGTTRIGSSAFYECEKLTTIDLDSQPLTRIDDAAFGYTALTSVTLPNTITTMNSGVFQYCSQLESANIPTGVTIVPSSTFYDCENLTNVTMHDGITQIGSSAFYNCKLLATIALNNQITNIGSSAFSGCENLEIEALPTALKTIESYVFQNTKAMTATLTIPETVTTIGYNAFDGSGITGVVMTTVPSSFSTEVFQNCKNLATVTLPADLKTIPNSTFSGCSALTTIDLPAGLTKIGDYAFRQSGLESITLPQTLQTIGTEAFYGTKLTEISVPKNVTSVGNRFAGSNKNLKTAYLGRNQNYTNNSYFDYFVGCDNLELLRVYAGTPPKISSGSSWNSSTWSYEYYTGYRSNCVLEVPEGTVDIYEATSIWTDFNKIVVFASDDRLNNHDFAVMKDLYEYLNGAQWTKPWDLSKQSHAIGKWQGVTTEADPEVEGLFYITEIDLTGQGLVGPLPKSLFTLEHLKTLNLSHNTIEAKVDTLIAEENTVITELNMEGNHLKGDLYPLVSKLPNLTKLNVGYNWLTAYSEKTPNSKLSNYNMRRGYQFIDWNTKKVNVPEELMDEVVVDITLGTPIEIESNTLQIYRHEYGDYNLSFNYMYPLSGTDYNYEGSLAKTNGQWDVNKSYAFKAKKGELVAYTHANPYYSYITYIFRFDWTDGDVNGDQTLDVSDLQNVVYYALNDAVPGNEMYNFTAADLNGDNKINVSDIVGAVNIILDYDGDDEPSGARIYNKVENDGRNTIKANASSLLIANADEVAALQLTISGARSAQLQLNGDLKSRFTLSMRDVADGVRVVIYSPMGNTLTPGESMLLSGLPVGATVTDARLVGVEANRLSVSYGNTTSIDELMAGDLRLEDMQIYDLSGRRVGKWNTLPRGVYIVNLNGKQFKVRK